MGCDMSYGTLWDVGLIKRLPITTTTTDECHGSRVHAPAGWLVGVATVSSSATTTTTSLYSKNRRSDNPDFNLNFLNDAEFHRSVPQNKMSQNPAS